MARRRRRSGGPPGGPPGTEGTGEEGENVVLYEIGRSTGRTAEEEEAARPPRRRRTPTLEVLREEPGWTAIHKPAGLASVKERWNVHAPTALSVLHDLWRTRDPDAPLPFVIHRIDKETSGLLLFARDRETARALSTAFRRRWVAKEYLALVDGRPPEPSGEIDLRLAPDPRRQGAMRVERKGGKKSWTAWETVEGFRGSTLLRVRPRTGRTHQVRVTLAHLGCPVTADPLYGDGRGLFLSSFKRRYVPPRDHPEIPLLGRLALHAHRLRFPDPAAAGGEVPEVAPGAVPEVVVEAPLPRDFLVALDKLRRWGALRPREPGRRAGGEGGWGEEKGE